MKLLKPDWVSHDGQPIFAIDIHPDGSRFATGGLGDGGSSGKVIIWNMTPVINEQDEENDTIPKVLCVMNNHLACVNSVRWSCNGRYLASGGDDRLIMIWQFAGYGDVGSFGDPSKLKSTVGERWRCTHTLKGHTGDVLDLAWSPANQWLASCSIDNTVMIWNAEKFPESTAVLKGHSSLVKGVTWDPIGSYLASQSDDKSVKIWKTLDWKLEETITDPFTECTATTHVLRLSWSPDGGYLVSAHAMNNSGPTAQIIQREGWKTDMDFVGHRKAITCTRFNGCVFSNPSSTKEDKKASSLPYTCCAVGSRDRSLSVWLTSLRRPLVVIHDLFDDSVMDISWAFTGYHLLCCSWDGTVAYVGFDKPEIGQTLTQQEKNKLHKDTYGKTSCVAQQPLIIENPAMLAIQQKKSDQAAAQGDQVDTKTSPTPHNYPTKQIETRTANGKRRIIPVFVAPQEALGGIPCPFGTNTSFGRPPSTSSLTGSAQKSLTSPPGAMETSPMKINNTSQDGVKMMVDEKTPEPKPPSDLPEPSPNEKVGTDKKKSPQKQANGDVEQKRKAVLDSRLCEKSTESNASEKGKTVQLPTFLSPSSKELDKRSPLQEPAAPPAKPNKAPSAAAPSPRKPGRPPLHLSRKVNGAGASPVRKRPYKQLRKDHVKHFSGGIGDAASVEQQATVSEVPGAGHKSHSTHHHVTPPLLPRNKLTRKIVVQSRDSAVPLATVTVVNDLTSDDKPVTSSLQKVSCSCEKEERWSTVMTSPAVCLHISEHIVGVACLDHSIHALSVASGRRLFPPIHLGSSVAQLHCKGHYLMAVDIACNLSVWDTKLGKAVVAIRSFAHLVDDVHRSHSKSSEPSPLRKCSLTDRGLPVVSLVNGKTYSFSLDLASWVLVRSTSDVVEQFAENVALPTDDHASSLGDQLLPSILKKVTVGLGAHASRSSHTDPATQRNATLAMLENKLAACVLIESVHEYKKWMLAYVRYLVQENQEVRLREVCNDLIGPVARRSKVSTKPGEPGHWKTHVLGIQKQVLLQDEVLPIVASNLAFQRLYTEYQDQLDNRTRRSYAGLNGGF